MAKRNKNHRISRCCLKNSRFWTQNSRCSRGWLNVAKRKQKSPNFAMLSQKFAILDSKFAMFARLASHVAKRNKKHRMSRRCLKNSRSTRRARTFSCTTMSIANFNGIASKALRYAQSYLSLRYNYNKHRFSQYLPKKSPNRTAKS